MKSQPFAHYASFALLAILSNVLIVHAAVPDVIPFQGRVSVGNVNFNGTGQFKFAIYQQPIGGGSQTLMWNNSAGTTSGALAEPGTAIPLTVTNGLYSLSLGDAVPSPALPASLQPTAGNKVFLRIWFSDGANGFQALTPDVALSSVPYAREAAKSEDAAKLNGQAFSFYLDRNNHTGTIPSTALSGNYAQALTLSSPSNSFSGSGAGLTTLNAGNLSSGTVADARLSSNIPLKNTANTFSAANTFSNLSNSFSGLGTGLTGLNAGNISGGTLGDARLSGNVALLDRTNFFSRMLAYQGTEQTVLDLVSSNTGGTWMRLQNTSPGARGFNFITTGSTNSEGAGKLLVRDADASAIRLTIDGAGDVGIGTTDPQAPLDVAVGGNRNLRFKNDLVPSLEVTSNNAGDGLAGIMRFRNAMEVWPSSDGTRAAKIDLRNAGGVTIGLDGGTGILTAKNLPAARFNSTVRDPRNLSTGMHVNNGSFQTLDTISVNVPASGLLIFTLTANVQIGNRLTTGRPGPILLKLEDATSGPNSAVSLVEIGSGTATNSGFTNSDTSLVLSWAQAVPAGAREYRSVLTNSSQDTVQVFTTTILVQYVPNSL